MVNPALKQRLLQEFQQRQQQESFAAQASRATEPSEDILRSSDSRLPNPDVLGVTAVPVERPPDAAEVQQPRVVVKAPSPSCSQPPAGPVGAAGSELLETPCGPQPERTKPSAAQPSQVPLRKRKVEILADTPLHILWDSHTKPEMVGNISVSSCATYSELWTAVGRLYGDSSRVNRATARLIYQDKEDGDWLALVPDGPSFSMFAGTVAQVMVVVHDAKAQSRQRQNNYYPTTSQ